MGKQNRQRGIPDADKHPELHRKAKKNSHGGAKPLVESLTTPGCMVTQKGRKAQDANKRR